MNKKDTSNKGAELRAVRDEKGLSRQDAVEFFGDRGYDFSTKSLQNWETGEREPRDVDLDALIDLLKDYQQERGPGDTGADYGSLSNSPESRSEADSVPDGDTVIRYRFFGRNFGTRGEPVPDVAEDIVLMSNRIIRLELGRAPDPDTTYWARVNGESMEPFLQDGAPVLVKETEGDVKAPGRYVLRLNSSGGIVNRCEKIGENVLRLTSDNCSFSDRVLTYQGGDQYEDRNGHLVRLQVQGRVIYPKDTAHAMKEQLVQDIVRAIDKSAR